MLFRSQLVDWLTHEVARLGVNVQLGTEATPELVKALNPDAVIVATGARRGKPAVPGADLPHVLTGDSLRALITGEASGNAVGPLARVVVGVGRRVGVLQSADRIRTLSKAWMPVRTTTSSNRLTSPNYSPASAPFSDVTSRATRMREFCVLTTSPSTKPPEK